MAVADGTVYGDTQSSVFALSAPTGKTTWVDRHLLNKGQGVFEIQPQVADGRVYLASAKGPGNGVLMALNAADGQGGAGRGGHTAHRLTSLLPTRTAGPNGCTWSTSTRPSELVPTRS
ncbi:MAG TPA: hypothetical protein VME46_21015 [Acidimicrobiales bacterium]|nr:hypothetical protein [Acidimicrobiales bacterium]